MATPRVTTMLPWVPLPGTTQGSSVPGSSESPDYTTYDTLSISVSPTLPEHPVSPNGEGVISEEVAVSLVLVAVLLFASTCLLLFFTLILHCCKCCCHGNSPPAHIIYHAPSYINPDARLAPEEYMLLNFNGRRVSAATTAGTGFFTLSAEGGGTAKSRDRSSFGSASTFAPTTRLLGDRRTSKTLPGVREIKNFLHDFNFKRARSFSSHVTAAEIAAVRRRVETANMQHRHRNRTRSTIVFDRSGSMVRPVSEISEHFYYSLFPEPNPDYVMETESNQSSIGDLRMGVPARVSTIELLSHDRFHRRRTNSNNLRIIWTGEQQFMSTTAPQASADVAPEIQDATPSEMVENEIYECYSDDEVKC